MAPGLMHDASWRRYGACAGLEPGGGGAFGQRALAAGGVRANAGAMECGRAWPVPRCRIRVQKRAGAPSHRLSGFGWSGVGGGRDRDPALGEGRIRIAVNGREVVERCAEGKLVKREKGEMECMERRREEKEKEKECADGSYWQARDPRAMHCP